MSSAVRPLERAASMEPRSFRPPELLTRRGRPARIALVHDWLDSYYGSERVVEQILACFPGADVFALVDFVPDDQRAFLGGRKVNTSFLQRLPLARRRFRQYLPLMPLAIEQFDLGAYDLVLSSNHAVAKGVLTGPEQPHLSYVHAPIRYAWEYQHQYLRESGLERGPMSWLTRLILHRIRLWDQRTANGVDRFLANSDFIRRRIRKTYRRDSEVVYPPVDVDAFPFRADKGAHYLAVSRFVPYKRTEAIVDAFRHLPDQRLTVVGEGPGLARAEATLPDNVRLLGRVSFERLVALMQEAKALVFAAEEDFGITPVEAQAAGTPVIAYGAGGALETVCGLDSDRPTGLFFDAQTPEAIAEGIRRFERDGSGIRPLDCHTNARRFAPDVFRRRYADEVIDLWRSEGHALSPATLAGLARDALAGH